MPHLYCIIIFQKIQGENHLQSFRMPVFFIREEGLTFQFFSLCFLMTWQHLEIIKINRESRNPEGHGIAAISMDFSHFSRNSLCNQGGLSLSIYVDFKAPMDFMTRIQRVLCSPEETCKNILQVSFGYLLAYKALAKNHLLFSIILGIKPTVKCLSVMPPSVKHPQKTTTCIWQWPMYLFFFLLLHFDATRKMDGILLGTLSKESIFLNEVMMS